MAAKPPERRTRDRTEKLPRTKAERRDDRAIERDLGLDLGGGDKHAPFNWGFPTAHEEVAWRRENPYPVPPTGFAGSTPTSDVDRVAEQRALQLLGRTPVESTGYDMDSARAAGMSPVPVPGDTHPHWGSRSPAFVSPAGIPEGLMLKGDDHPTERLGLNTDREGGAQFVQRDGRVVSVQPQDIQPTDHLLDLARMLQGGR